MKKSFFISIAISFIQSIASASASSQPAFICRGLAGNFPGYILYLNDQRVDYFSLYHYGQNIDLAGQACSEEISAYDSMIASMGLCLCATNPDGSAELEHFSGEVRAEVLRRFGPNDDGTWQGGAENYCQLAKRELIATGACPR